MDYHSHYEYNCKNNTGGKYLNYTKFHTAIFGAAHNTVASGLIFISKCWCHHCNAQNGKYKNIQLDIIKRIPAQTRIKLVRLINLGIPPKETGAPDFSDAPVIMIWILYCCPAVFQCRCSALRSPFVGADRIPCPACAQKSRSRPSNSCRRNNAASQ